MFVHFVSNNMCYISRDIDEESFVYICVLSMCYKGYRFVVHYWLLFIFCLKYVNRDMDQEPILDLCVQFAIKYVL